jgi:hypothetical protein
VFAVQRQGLHVPVEVFQRLLDADGALKTKYQKSGSTI